MSRCGANLESEGFGAASKEKEKRRGCMSLSPRPGWGAALLHISIAQNIRIKKKKKTVLRAVCTHACTYIHTYIHTSTWLPKRYPVLPGLPEVQCSAVQQRRRRRRRRWDIADGTATNSQSTSRAAHQQHPRRAGETPVEAGPREHTASQPSRAPWRCRGAECASGRASWPARNGLTRRLCAVS